MLAQTCCVSCNCCLCWFAVAEVLSWCAASFSFVHSFRPICIQLEPCSIPCVRARGRACARRVHTEPLVTVSAHRTSSHGECTLVTVSAPRTSSTLCSPLILMLCLNMGALALTHSLTLLDSFSFGFELTHLQRSSNVDRRQCFSTGFLRCIQCILASYIRHLPDSLTIHSSLGRLCTRRS